MNVHGLTRAGLLILLEKKNWSSQGREEGDPFPRATGICSGRLISQGKGRRKGEPGVDPTLVRGEGCWNENSIR